MSALSDVRTPTPPPLPATEPRPRVLVLSRAYPNPVTENLGLWIARPTVELSRSVDVCVVAPVPYCPPVPGAGRLREYTRFRAVPAIELRDGIDVHHPRFVVGPGDSLYRFEARTYYEGVRPVVDTLRRSFPFDLIHAHFVYPDGVVAHRLAERYGVPFVMTEHAPWVPWLERPGVREPALAAGRAAAGLVAVSSYVRDTISHYLGDSVSVSVIPNGVDGEAFSPNGAGGRRSHDVLYVGVVNFNKGIDVLLEAMALLRKRDARFRLRIAGGSFYRNTRLQEEKLRRLAQQRGLGDCVEFLGPQPPAGVVDLMRESAVVLLPSRAESFGSVLIEALACGTPVIATRSGGPQDIVTDGVGRLVAVGDALELAEAVQDVVARRAEFDPDQLRAYALERFGLPNVAQQVRDLYRAVVRA